MARKPVHLNPIAHIEAEAIGDPGSRIFYILASDNNVTLRFKIEKSQLEVIALGIKRILEGIQENHPKTPPAPEAKDRKVLWPDESEVSFTVGEAGLGYEQDRDLFMISLYDIEGTIDQSPPFMGWATTHDMKDFSQQIESICAAGRPICPLCQSPMNPSGHSCPRSNGHATGVL